MTTIEAINRRIKFLQVHRGQVEELRRRILDMIEQLRMNGGKRAMFISEIRALAEGRRMRIRELQGAYGGLSFAQGMMIINSMARGDAHYQAAYMRVINKLFIASGGRYSFPLNGQMMYDNDAALLWMKKLNEINQALEWQKNAEYEQKGSVRSKNPKSVNYERKVKKGSTRSQNPQSVNYKPPVGE